MYFDFLIEILRYLPLVYHLKSKFYYYLLQTAIFTFSLTFELMLDCTNCSFIDVVWSFELRRKDLLCLVWMTWSRNIFRWALGDNNACLISSQFLNHTNVMKHLETITFSPVLPIEDGQAVCQTNDSLFVLVGNPGVIWHPKSGQCLHTKLDTYTPNSAIHLFFDYHLY